jgi:hypothetical protein
MGLVAAPRGTHQQITITLGSFSRRQSTPQLAMLIRSSNR